MNRDGPGPFIPAIGIHLAWQPPEGYERYRQILGTAAIVPCSGSGSKPCDQPAVVLRFMELPARPYCAACYETDGPGDVACGTLAATDETGTWRATHQGFDPSAARRPDDWRAAPYAFDW